MRLESDFSSAVTFLTVVGPPDASGVAKAIPVGTAFLVGEPLGDTGKRAPWLITARHVIDNTQVHEELYFRVARDDGSVATKSAPHSHWVRHPATDVAMVRIHLGFQTQQLKWIPLEMLITEAEERDGTMSVGDEAFMLTVLPENAGADRDRPIARFGHISKLAPDPVRLSGGPNHPIVTLPRAILIEATTWPANSGAPVFVHRPRRVDIDDVEGQLTVENFPTRLMGLCAGHYAVPAAMSLADGEAAIGLNSGVSVVTPAGAILDLMRRPEHLAWRESEVARLLAHEDLGNESTDLPGSEESPQG